MDVDKNKILLRKWLSGLRRWFAKPKRFISHGFESRLPLRWGGVKVAQQAHALKV